MQPTRILHVMGGVFGYGGTEAYIMSYYRNIDKTKFQFDFIVHGFEKGVYDEEITELGGQIYNVPIKSKDYFGNIKALKVILGTGKYRIVHSHMDAMGMIVLKLAKKFGIPVRIADSLNTNHQTTNKIQYALNEYARKNIQKYATHLTSCSELAGSWLFGEDAVRNGKVKIFKTAIDFDDFRFNEDKRALNRAEYNISDNFVIGHIGRFSEQKNHLFLLDVFYEILKLNPKAKLLLAGFGHLQEQIEKKISDLGITSNVIMLGAISGSSVIINAFDVFLLPSLYEGQPIVLTEAQANGLQCFVSDTITREVDIFSFMGLPKLVSFLSLEESAADWAGTILGAYDPTHNRVISGDDFALTGYEIKAAAKGLQDYYEYLMKEPSPHQ